MKKFFSILIICLILFSCFATNNKVCIYPANEELSKSLKNYLDVNTLNSSVKCDDVLLLTGDTRLMEYICNSTKADLLLIPFVEDISEYKYLRLYSFKNDTKEYTLEYESISNDIEFSYDVIKILYDHLFKNDSEVNEYNPIDRSLNITYSNSSLLIDCANTVADIYLNDKYLGQTPFILESYYVPSVVKFCSEGFADRVCSLTDINTNELKVTLISDIKSDVSNFNKAQNKYYISFASAILGWGSRIIISALDIKNPTLNNALNGVSWGLAISSSLYLGFNIYNYFNATQNTSP